MTYEVWQLIQTLCWIALIGLLSYLHGYADGKKKGKEKP